ncbi:archaetidylserine decarboxylase [Ideonella margarita]|uniref:phosphatidylserine decarboxylase n=1 Tax=Ideonella margarita TaxID=2984191 RepID=A0ABU9C441_9BURK
MTLKKWRDRLLLQEDLNFLLTNRIPRLAVTRFVGRFSQIRHPWVARVSIGAWRMFSDLDLSEARKTRFESLHDCFVRELKPGARPVDQSAEVLASPSDGIVGECGAVEGQRLWQAKGFPYSLSDLFGSEAAARPYEDGCYVTLRLTASMYHRFHAPHDAVLRHVTHIAGDTWNVNPIALKRVERLFCRNERASLHLQLAGSGHPVALVPVAAILVASLRLHAPDLLLHHRYGGPNELPCEVPMTKGQELGWFQHGSTIIVFAPKGFTLAPGVATGVTVRAGQALMRLPEGGA